MAKERNRVIDWLVYVAVRVVICVIQALPLAVCDRLANFIAWLAYDKLRNRRKVTLENLRQAFPEKSGDELDTIARKMWRHLVLLGCELVHAPRKIRRSNWHRHVRTKNVDLQVQHLLDDRPVVVVSGHFGNFEVGGWISALLGYQTFSIARPFPNPYLDRYINGLRSSTGQQLLPKTGSSYDVDRVLSANGILMLLGDQSAGRKGCWINFFGRPASCHKSVALFSLTQNAPMVVAYSKRVDDRPLQFEIGVMGVYDPKKDGPMSIEELTQWHSDLLAEAIQENPEQYFWLHRRWRDPPANVVRRLERQESKNKPTSGHKKSA